MTNLQPGMPAPDWSAQDQHGNTHSLAEYRGKWLLLYFYPKDDTPGCTIQACGIRDAFGAFKGNVEVLGVSKDSADSHRKFTEKYSLPFPLLVDTSMQMVAKYEATGSGFGKRVSFLIDPEGVVRKIYTGFDCNVHAAMVLEDKKVLAG